jgi:hypothetical protein
MSPKTQHSKLNTQHFLQSVVVSRILFTDTATLFFCTSTKRTLMATQLSEPNNEFLGASVFSDNTLSRRAKVMYGVMLKYADVNGRLTVTHEMLMKDIGVFAKKSVGLATQELAEKGVLKRRRTRAAVRYQLLK